MISSRTIFIRLASIGGLMVGLFASSGVGTLAQVHDLGHSQFVILLKTRQFLPQPGLEQALEDVLRVSKEPKLHAIIQLDDIPDATEKALLKEAGVELLDYIPNKA